MPSLQKSSLMLMSCLDSAPCPCDSNVLCLTMVILKPRAASPLVGGGVKPKGVHLWLLVVLCCWLRTLLGERGPTAVAGALGGG